MPAAQANKFLDKINIKLSGTFQLMLRCIDYMMNLIFSYISKSIQH